MGERSDRRGFARVAELRDLLEHGHGRPDTLRQFLAGLRELTGADHSLAVSYRFGGAHLESELVEGDRIDVDHFRRTIDGFLARTPVVGWSKYNPVQPEPEQQNQVIGWDDLIRLYGTDWSPGRDTLYPALGIHRDDQLRVLVCDGPSLLGLVAIVRDVPFTSDERRRLEALVEPLQQHLKRERELALGPFGTSALEVALEAIGAPALVVKEGRVVLANPAGRAWLIEDSHDVAGAIAQGQSTRGAVERTAFHSSGMQRHELVVLRPAKPTTQTRIAAFARRYRLTPRQAEVLEHLVEGRSNRTIAALLGVSERTLEVHVSALLAKAECDSRSEVIARVLTSSE